MGVFCARATSGTPTTVGSLWEQLLCRFPCAEPIFCLGSCLSWLVSLSPNGSDIRAVRTGQLGCAWFAVSSMGPAVYEGCWPVYPEPLSRQGGAPMPGASPTLRSAPARRAVCTSPTRPPARCACSCSCTPRRRRSSSASSPMTRATLSTASGVSLPTSSRSCSGTWSRSSSSEG